MAGWPAGVQVAWLVRCQSGWWAGGTHGGLAADWPAGVLAAGWPAGSQLAKCCWKAGMVAEWLAGWACDAAACSQGVRRGIQLGRGSIGLLPWALWVPMARLGSVLVGLWFPKGGGVHG